MNDSNPKEDVVKDYSKGKEEVVKDDYKPKLLAKVIKKEVGKDDTKAEKILAEVVQALQKMQRYNSPITTNMVPNTKRKRKKQVISAQQLEKRKRRKLVITGKPLEVLEERKCKHIRVNSKDSILTTPINKQKNQLYDCRLCLHPIAVDVNWYSFLRMKQNREVVEKHYMECHKTFL